MPKRTLTQFEHTHSNRNKVAHDVAWSQCFIHIALFGYSERQMITLQGVNRVLYKRVAQWVKIVKVVAIRLSEVACLNTHSTRVFVFPTSAEIIQWRGVLPHLTGFENNWQDGRGWYMNLILSNGHRSNQRDEGETYYDHLMPAGSHNKIRSVSIYYYSDHIDGFSFFDKERALLLKIGETDSDDGEEKETVLLEENEVIVGVVAKLYNQHHSCYTDFQFQIASKPDFN